jgi:hypothetical protein
LAKAATDAAKDPIVMAQALIVTQLPSLAYKPTPWKAIKLGKAIENYVRVVKDVFRQSLEDQARASAATQALRNDRASCPVQIAQFSPSAAARAGNDQARASAATQALRNDRASCPVQIAQFSPSGVARASNNRASVVTHAAASRAGGPASARPSGVRDQSGHSSGGSSDRGQSGHSGGAGSGHSGHSGGGGHHDHGGHDF